MADTDTARTTGWGRQVARRAYALMLLAIGGVLVWLGARLIMLGGSPYYVGAGIMTAGAGWLLWRGDRRGAWLYALMLAGTLLWALWEVGFDGWALLPRVAGPAVLGLWLLTPWAYDRAPARKAEPTASRIRGPAVATALLAVVIVAAGITMIRHGRSSAQSPVDQIRADTNASDGVEWLNYGNDRGGLRFSPLSLLTTANVDQLRPAWRLRTGHLQPGQRPAFESTPLKIGDTLYICTPYNDIIAIDAETGEPRWRFNAKSDHWRVGHPVCRGVAYYRSPGAAGPCAERIITATIDGRLIAVDAARGVPCRDFGNSGTVNLLEGLGTVEKGYYYVTSAPQITRGRIVLGGWVSDNQHIGEPSGVVRAFDAVTGKLSWAFDMGRPAEHGPPQSGETYTPGTPNSWAPISADEALGLVYMPTGNAVPDWYGGLRRPIDDRYSSSVVAIDAETGAVRWSFQTTHHDLWDYDVASQPTLYDMPVDNQRIPALIQPTKRGEIFVLDRRTGKPITEIEERPVPASHVPGERSSPTQPFSVGMPSFGGPPLTEKMMWGITPIDQLLCRIAFRESRYEGTLTPPGLDKPVVVYPGYLGGNDWGGVSIDTDRDIMIVNANRVAIRSQLVPRAVADKKGIRPISATVDGNVGGTSAQAGTPYAVNIKPFMSVLGVPCQQPPYGMISAVDMKTRKLLWTQPLGSARDSGPLGTPSMLPITMGVPAAGGAVTTRSGLTFISATLDRYLRAFDTRTGRKIWEARLPAGGQATPMTYLSRRSGRQFVVVAAGGHDGLGSKLGDYVVAYSLPRPAPRP